MDDAVMAVITLGFFILLFGFIVLMRYINYRETLTLAEKGLVRPDRSRRSGLDTLRWGIVITAVGLALCIGLYPIGFSAGPRFLLGLGPWMLAGLLPTFFGLGLILIYVLTREPKDEQDARDARRLDDERAQAPLPPSRTPAEADRER